MTRAVAAALALSFGAAAGSFAAGAPSAPLSPFRYDDDPAGYASAPADDVYAKLKYIPLGPEDYLALGADLRERVEASDVGLLGLRNPGANAYDLHRLLVFADLQLGPDVRGFVQLGDHEEVGRKPAAIPTDTDQLELSLARLGASLQRRWRRRPGRPAAPWPSAAAGRVPAEAGGAMGRRRS